MPKPIVFEFEGAPVSYEMNKVDRSRLYGFKELEVIDEEGAACELSTLADDGKTLIGKGGTGIGYLTADGDWVDKSNLKAVDLEGKEITPVPSSFAAPIPLQETATIDDYLDHNVRLVYMLDPKEVSESLHKSLMDGAIYKFPYSYRGGLEPDVGFLLCNEDKEVFFLVGDQTSVDFKSLQQSAGVAATEEAPEDEGAGDLMDFGMI